MRTFITAATLMISVLMTLATRAQVTGREREMHRVAKEVISAYYPLAELAHKKLVLNWDMRSSITNVTGNEIPGNIWQIHAYGGLVLNSNLTTEAFRFILCHEIGHILGGNPRWPSIYPGIMNSNSGQPDYYAASVCMKLVLRGQDNVRFVQRSRASAAIVTTCQSRFASYYPSMNEIAICIRTLQAGEEGLRFIAGVLGSPMPDIHHRDPQKAKLWEQAHPNVQCRLDTVVAGALCIYQPTGRAINEGEIANQFCASLPKGLGRPACWFPTSPR